MSIPGSIAVFLPRFKRDDDDGSDEPKPKKKAAPRRKKKVNHLIHPLTISRHKLIPFKADSDEDAEISGSEDGGGSDYGAGKKRKRAPAKRSPKKKAAYDSDD